MHYTFLCASLKSDTMYKLIILFTCFFLSEWTLIAQSKNDSVLGKMILDEQMENIKKFNGRADCTNYWNMAVAYRHLERPADSIYNFLVKSMEDNPGKFLELIDFLVQYTTNDIKTTSFYYLLGDRFLTLVDTAKRKSMDQKREEPIVNNIINQEVVDTLIALMKDDQKYRSQPLLLNEKSYRDKQAILDNLNASKLFKLYQKYGYPGKSITGDNEYQDYFCLMVEHGQNESGQKRFWLPIIADAFKKDELSASVFKMLLDRIHWLETGKQYFGSHVGIPLDTPDNISKVREMYGL
jgi:hypothetical protein